MIQEAVLQSPPPAREGEGSRLAGWLAGCCPGGEGLVPRGLSHPARTRTEEPPRHVTTHLWPHPDPRWLSFHVWSPTWEGWRSLRPELAWPERLAAYLESKQGGGIL